MAVLSYTAALEFRIFSSDLSTGISYTEARDFRICLIYVMEFGILRHCTVVEFIREGVTKLFQKD